ncbi:MAG: hypothetical protein ACKV2U_28410 [Bryobacteraceae bacterium]
MPSHTVAFQYAHPDPVYRFRLEIPSDWQHAPPDSAWGDTTTPLAHFTDPHDGLQLSVALARKSVDMLPADLARITLRAVGESLLRLDPCESIGAQACWTTSLNGAPRRILWLVLDDRCWLISFTASPEILESRKAELERIAASFSLSNQSPAAPASRWFHSSTGFPFRFELLAGWERLSRRRITDTLFQSRVAGAASQLAIVWGDNPKQSPLQLCAALSLTNPGPVRYLPSSPEFPSRWMVTADSWLGLGFACPEGCLLIVAAGLDCPADSVPAAAARAALQLAASSLRRAARAPAEFHTHLAQRMLATGLRWFAILNEDFVGLLGSAAGATEHLTLSQTGILLAELPAVQTALADLLSRLWDREAMVLAAASCSLQDLARHWRVLLLLEDGDRLATFPAHQPDLLAYFLSSTGPDSRRAFLGPARELWIESENGQAILRVTAKDCLSFRL